MAEIVNRRRSWMIVPAHDAAAVTRCQEFKPDVVVLDLEYSVPPKAKEAARARPGGARREDRRKPDRSLRARRPRNELGRRRGAAMHRGIKGIVFPGPEEPEKSPSSASSSRRWSRNEGVEPGTTELVLMLESAKGFWNAAALAQRARASPRWAWDGSI